MRRDHTADARRRGDTPAKAGATPRPRQWAPGGAPRQGGGRPAESSSDGLVNVFEAQSGAAAVASRAASAFTRGTDGADHARAHGRAEAAARLAAAVAEQLACYHARRASDAEAGPEGVSPHPNARPAGEAAPAPGPGSARTAARRNRRRRARAAEGPEAEAEVVAGGAVESAPRASSDATNNPGDGDLQQPPRQTPATEPRHPNTEHTSTEGAETDGEEPAAESESGGARSRTTGGRSWRSRGVRLAAEFADRAEVERELRGLSTSRALARSVGTRAGFEPAGEEETTHHRQRRLARTLCARVGSAPALRDPARLHFTCLGGEGRVVRVVGPKDQLGWTRRLCSGLRAFTVRTFA